jgi:Cu(I)/Ag(I) efflux system membrane fusion protein/cobalt-zinc-cadmium efflux system membrane fusion protein
MTMKRKAAIPLLVLLLILTLAAGYFLGAGRHAGPGDHAPEGEQTAAKQKAQYTCGMHPFIIQEEPGLCPICGMKLTPLKAGTAGGKTAAGGGERKIKYWQAPMDPTYIRDEPGKSPMGMDLIPVYEDEVGGSAITIDPVTAQNMGVRTAPVERRDLARTVRTVGVITYEEPRRFSVNSKIDGWIERLFVNQEGQSVKKGEPLMELYSPELVAAQQEYLLALQSSRRLGESPFPEIAESSRRLLEASRNRLSYWDISDKQIRTLEQTGEVRKSLTLYSPYNGVVTMKKAFEGMRVMGGEELLQVSDISNVWVNADVYEFELPWVKLGQTARVELPFAPGKALEGKITYIYPYLEPMSRTVKVRIALANPGFDLKPDMYANVRIETEPVENVLAIPDHAVLQSGKGQTVFVALGEGRFEPRSVQTGVGNDEGLVQILSGVKEGERVVTSAQFMLDSESKLREAIQKMMAPREDPADVHEGHEMPEEELDDLFK